VDEADLRELLLARRLKEEVRGMGPEIIGRVLVLVVSSFVPKVRALHREGEEGRGASSTFSNEEVPDCCE